MCLEEQGQAGLPGISGASGRTRARIYADKARRGAKKRKAGTSQEKDTRGAKRHKGDADGSDADEGDTDEGDADDEMEVDEESDADDAEAAQVAQADDDVMSCGEEGGDDADKDTAILGLQQLARVGREFQPEVKKKGPPKLPPKLIRARANAKRTEARKRRGPASRKTERPQLEMGTYLVQHFSELLEVQLEIERVVEGASTTMDKVAAADAVLRRHQSLAPLPLPPTLSNASSVMEMLLDLIDNPLDFHPDAWVQSGVLVEDRGQFLPAKTARFYLRVGLVPAARVQASLTRKMTRRPADISWLAVLMLIHGVSVKEVSDAAGAALRHYNLDLACAMITSGIEASPGLSDLLAAFAGRPSDAALSLCYPGVTIAGTPFQRLEDDLTLGQYSRFTNIGKQLRWRTFLIRGIDIPAPDGALAFRTDQRIGRTEAVLVNTCRLLGMNTTPGGTWIPTYARPRISPPS
ncbi:hypothetical protein FB451DRAFT_528166 [Mycena latifolia]|nr:hypothetical protein FB451DRAFT_528166 [Mycena latifolia]